MMIKYVDQLAEKIKLGIGLRFGELKEVLRRKRAEIRAYKDAHKRKEFPIYHSTEDPNSIDQAGRKRYLQYCLSLIKREHPKAHDLLVLLLCGYSHKKIADEMNKMGFNVTVATVHKKEREARLLIETKIRELRERGVPIFSEMPV